MAALQLYYKDLEFIVTNKKNSKYLLLKLGNKIYNKFGEAVDILQFMVDHYELYMIDHINDQNIDPIRNQIIEINKYPLIDKHLELNGDDITNLWNITVQILIK